MTFIKGGPGGPGRPKGVRSFVKDIGEQNVKIIAELILDGARRKDAGCLKLAADRIWPALTRSELSGIDGDAIAVDAPNWRTWPTEDLRELRAAAARIAEQRKARANGNGAEPTAH